MMREVFATMTVVVVDDNSEMSEENYGSKVEGDIRRKGNYVSTVGLD